MNIAAQPFRSCIVALFISMLITRATVLYQTFLQQSKRMPPNAVL